MAMDGTHQIISIAMEALRMACKTMRENPPGDLDQYSPELLQCLVGGKNDPDGKKFVDYFLKEAMQKVLFYD